MSLLVVLSLVGASGYVVPGWHAQRACVQVRAVAEDLSVVSNKVVADLRECLVEAENAAQQAECFSSDSEVVPTATTAARPVDECIVEAENAAEIAACADTTLGTTYEECVVNAENLAEIEDCGEYKAVEAELYVSLEDECVVDAENAAELLACADTTLGTTYEECIVQAENAAEIEDC